MLNEINKGMAIGLGPQLTFDGTAGTYQLRDQHREVVGIFKPIDEEAFAPNNPRGYISDFGQKTFRNGVLSGEGVIREVASFMIDHEHFSCVPPTIFAEMMHPSFHCSLSQEAESTDLTSSSNKYQSVITSLVEPRASEGSSDSTVDASSAAAN